MLSSFPRTLSLMRKEKGISQKQAAISLGVSQALLSHYENGVREPGLQFVVAAADFYGVSTDFLLGRTMSRDGNAINVDELYDDASTKENRVARGGVIALMSKKLAVNSLGIIFDLVSKSGNRDLIRELYSCISIVIYKLFYAIYSRSGSNSSNFFSISSDDMPEIVNARLSLAELKYRRQLDICQNRDSDNRLPEISHNSITRDYPLLCQSLFSLIHAAERDIAEMNGSNNQ